MKINKNWRIEKKDAPLKPYLIVIAEFAYKSNITEYPVCLTNPYTTVQYDDPHRVPGFVKRKVEKMFTRHPECRY